MKFSANQIELQKSLNYCQGVIEKRSTLPILSNILLDVSNSRLTITATDLDLIFLCLTLVFLRLRHLHKKIRFVISFHNADN